MRTPYHLLPTLATVQAPTVAVSNATQTRTYSGGVTVQCRIQHDASRESIERERLEGVATYTGMFAPVDTAGNAVTITKDTLVVVGSTTYRAIGPGRDQGAAGVLILATLEVRT